MGGRLQSPATRREQPAPGEKLSRPPGWARVAKRLVIDRDPWPLRARVTGRRPVVSVQMYVDGAPANVAVACLDGEVLGAVQADVVQSDGQLGPSTVIKLVDDAELLAAVGEMARCLRPDGVVRLRLHPRIGDRSALPRRDEPACHPDRASLVRRRDRPPDVVARMHLGYDGPAGPHGLVPRRAGRPVSTGDAARPAKPVPERRTPRRAERLP